VAGGPLQQLGGPTGAVHPYGTTEGAALEADGVADHLGPRHLGDRGPLGQRGGGRGQIGPVEVDPAALHPHERRRLLGEPGDVGRVELQIVEQHRPAHVGQLAHPDLRVAPDSLGEQAQLGLRLAARDLGHHHLEAGRLQRLPGGEHELDGLFAVQHHLAAPGSGPAKGRDQALDPPELGLDLLRLRTGGHH
jgi:hypothetical protein